MKGDPHPARSEEWAGCVREALDRAGAFGNQKTTPVLEAHFMPRKKPRFEAYARANDPRSRLFADHDWSDEVNHARNGKRWLDELLKDDARSIRDIKEEVGAMLNASSNGASEVLSPF